MSRPRFTIRARAVRDLVGHADWLRQEADGETADRFLQAAQRSFGALAETPGLGGEAGVRAAELKGARKWRVDGFPNHLIFYAPRDDGRIAILRVLHAARNWMAP